VIYFDDELQTQRGFATHLRMHGFDLTTTNTLAEAEAMIEKPDCELLVYGGMSGESWQLCQSIVQRAPNFPVLYLFVNDDPREKQVKTDELHQIVRPLSARGDFLDMAEQLIRVGKLHRRIQELSGLASGPAAVEAMFERLDVHHILDRMLDYFGSRAEAENIHWLRWQDLPHMLQGDHAELNLEMEVEDTRSPKMLSYRGVEAAHVFSLLRKTLRTDTVLSLSTREFMTANAEGNPLLYVVVKSLDGTTPLGLLIFEGCPSGEAVDLAPQILESLKLMARFVEFGLSHYDGKNLALIDDLTELFNQRYLPTVIDNEINRSKRRNAAFTLLFLDLDFFKMVNDTRGHWIGSKLLQEVGQIVKSSIRSCDYGFRYGGDEFVVVLPETDVKGGQIVGERIRKSVEEARFLIDGHEIRLTVSVGLAGYPEHAKTKEQIIQLADQAMYYGKRKSRNIVYSAS
jgi:diguanylate cyclase (GGDEF)-like protein